MKKLILLFLILINFNSLAEEYNVVCFRYNSTFIIKNIESYNLAEEIIKNITVGAKTYFDKCLILKVKN